MLLSFVAKNWLIDFLIFRCWSWLLLVFLSNSDLRDLLVSIPSTCPSLLISLAKSLNDFLSVCVFCFLIPWIIYSYCSLVGDAGSYLKFRAFPPVSWLNLKDAWDSLPILFFWCTYPLLSLLADLWPRLSLPSKLLWLLTLTTFAYWYWSTLSRWFCWPLISLTWLFLDGLWFGFSALEGDLWMWCWYNCEDPLAWATLVWLGMNIC